MANKLYWDVWEDTLPISGHEDDTGSTKRTHRVFYTNAKREAAKKEHTDRKKEKRRQDKEGNISTGKHQVKKSGVLEKTFDVNKICTLLSRFIGMTSDDFFNAISDIITYENGWTGHLLRLAGQMIYMDCKKTNTTLTIESFRKYLQYPYWDIRRFVLTFMLNQAGYAAGMKKPLSGISNPTRYYPYWEKIRGISDEELFRLAKQADKCLSDKHAKSQSEAMQKRAFGWGDDVTEDDIKNLPLAVVVEKGIDNRYADLIDPNSEEFRKNKELLGEYGIDYIEATDAVTGKTMIVLLFNGRKQEYDE